MNTQLESRAELRSYQLEARAWLADNAPSYCGERRRGLTPDQDLALGRAWQRLKSDHGYAAINLPREHGGGGGTEAQKIIFANEEGRYNLPLEYFAVSLGMPVPLLLRYGSPEVVADLVPKAIRGEQIWCQLFSEPGAGSDLAAVATRATRDGPGWRLNGQKVWTSLAHCADWGIVLVRTDPTLPKHAGLTYFYLDMRSPGIDIRRIRKLAGVSQINEVFLSDVFVPDSYRIGPVGGGFKVAIETLMFERYSGSDETLGCMGVDQLVELAEVSRRNGKSALEDGELRAFIAETLAERQGLRNIFRRAMIAIAAGKEPGPEGSIRKLLLSRRVQATAEMGMNLMGADALVYGEDRDAATDATVSWLLSPPLRIAGGTDEIQRNTIAEKILGLPQDHRPDKGVPFNQLR